MCGPWVCFCLINIFSFGWRFSSGLSLERSQQQSQSLSANCTTSRARFTDQLQRDKEREAVGQVEEEQTDKLLFKYYQCDFVGKRGAEWVRTGVYVCVNVQSVSVCGNCGWYVSIVDVLRNKSPRVVFLPSV